MPDRKITKIIAKEVLDSRGNPTVEATVFTSKLSASAIVPSGASTGMHEALELRDNQKRYNGMGVLKAVSNVNNIISKKVVGEDCTQQRQIDNLMIGIDGTENKTILGANAILAVSMAVCRLASLTLDIPLYEYISSLSKRQLGVIPLPQLNVINGGRHAGQENDIQEHSIIPVKAKSFSEAIRMAAETYHNLKKGLKQKYGARATLIGDEGGFVPPINNVNERLELMTKAINESGYKTKIKIALDCAASEFHIDGKYNLEGKVYSAGELVDFYKELCKKFEIVSIEDGMAEEDWVGWIELTKQLGKKIQIIGDDLLVTSVDRIKRAAIVNACNSLLLKVNQIGTVTESIDAAELAFKHNWKVVVSHRSGETEDTFIADLVVGLGAGQCKFGAPARAERTAKYNRLLKIEDQLGSRAVYPKMF